MSLKVNTKDRAMSLRSRLIAWGLVSPKEDVFSIPKLPKARPELVFENQPHLKMKYGVACRRFVMHRKVDAKNLAGTGIIAEGIEFTNGQCVLHWMTHMSSTSIYESIRVVEYLHGHGENTEILYID